MKKSLFIGILMVSTSILANEFKAVSATQKEKKQIVHVQPGDKGVQAKMATTLSPPMKKKAYPRGVIATH